ncbi:MAG: hypothetical protein RIF33_21965 [Cyclobacteriaceae bacterium]
MCNFQKNQNIKLSSKRAHIQRQEAYDLFVRAFAIAKIPYEEEYDQYGRKLIKPQTKWYDKLSIEIENLFPEIENFPNYPKYLKDRYNDIKRALYSKDDQRFGYDVQLMQPLWSYARQQLDKAEKRVFHRTVLLARKKYPWFNIWRMPDPGQLTRFRHGLLFEGKVQTITLSLPLSSYVVKMPPLSGDWLAVTNGSQTYYMAISDGRSRLALIDPLRSFLSSDLTTK